MPKKIISFTIDNDLFLKWKNYVKLNFINSSQLIEKLMKNHLENEVKK
ncbi:MAG TPA: hypothetical protein VJB35_06300 [Candidatus Nanoarchaeia archaeon]|nr:hypothetical protein [Candidatus Nanoarchaeia archaeon]